MIRAPFTRRYRCPATKLRKPWPDILRRKVNMVVEHGKYDNPIVRRSTGSPIVVAGQRNGALYTFPSAFTGVKSTH